MHERCRILPGGTTHQVVEGLHASLRHQLQHFLGGIGTASAPDERLCRPGLPCQLSQEMKILRALPTVDQLVASSKFCELADHGSQSDVPGASSRSMTESLAEKVPDLHKSNIWKREKALRKTFPTPSHYKHELLTALGHGYVDILEHTGFPCRCGVGDHDASCSQNRNAVNNPEAWIKGFLRQFCPTRDGDFNNDPARCELSLCQDLLHGLRKHLARHRVDGWFSWWDWQAFFGDQANPLTAHKMHTRLSMPRHTGTDLSQVRDVRVVTSIFNDAAAPCIWGIGAGVEQEGDA